MSDRQTGWIFVVVQIVLLLAVIFLPAGDDWSQPGWLRVVTVLLRVVGLGLLVAGVIGLGSSLTPTPVPMEQARLKTGGLYGLMRHPIYTGVILIVVGSVIGSGSILRAAIGAITVVFFNVKAAWEESRLARHYPEYASYAASVPRFIPRP